MAAYMRLQNEVMLVLNNGNPKTFADGTTHPELHNAPNRMWAKIRFMIHELSQPHVFVSDPKQANQTVLRDDDILIFLDGLLLPVH